MENQKIINLLDKDDIDLKHFATKIWYIINDENNANYGVNKNTGANNPDTIKYDTRVLKPNLCDYADAYILVDGTIRADAEAPPLAAPANIANARLPLKYCAPFTKCNLEINDEHVDTAEKLDIVMPMYNLIEYSDNYQDSSAMLYQYKRDEPPVDIANNLTQNNSTSFDYKIKLLGKFNMEKRMCIIKSPLTKCNLEINDEHVETAEKLDIVMPMYNLMEYLDNYQLHSSATLYQYKRDEPPEDDAVANLTADNSDSFSIKLNY